MGTAHIVAHETIVNHSWSNMEIVEKKPWGTSGLFYCLVRSDDIRAEYDGMREFAIDSEGTVRFKPMQPLWDDC